MTVRELEKNLKEGIVQKLYLICGPDEWQKEKALCCLREALLPTGLEELNDVTLDNPSIREIIECSEMMPVMSDRRMVVVRDLALLGGNKTEESGSETENKPRSGNKPDKSEAGKLSAYLEDIPETTVLVFWMTSDAQPGKNVLAKLEKGHPEIIIADHLQGKELQMWCASQLKPFGKKITSDAINEMTLMAGYDLVSLETELRKLVSYAESKEIIEIEDVRVCVSPTVEYVSYLLLDSILDGDYEKAALTADAVLSGSTTSVGLINLLASQLRYDIHINLGKAENRPDLDIAKDLAFKGRSSDNRVRAIYRQSRKYPTRTLEQAFLMCVKANYDSTSGQKRGDAVLDALLLELCRLFGKGKRG